MDLSCDFNPFFKRMLLCVLRFLHKLLQKVTNTNELKYSSQHWNLMKQMSKKINKLFTVQVGPYRKIFSLGLSSVPRPSVSAASKTSGNYISLRTSQTANNLYVSDYRVVIIATSQHQHRVYRISSTTKFVTAST